MIFSPTLPLSKLGDVPKLNVEPADALERSPYPELLVLAFFNPPSEFLCLVVDSRFVFCANPLTSDVEVDVDNGIASTPDKSLVLEGSLSNTLDVGVYVGNGKLLLEGVCAGVTTGDPRSRSNADNELVLGVFPW